MEYTRVRKSKALEGRVQINGAKNAALPILAASLLGTEKIVLYDVPRLADVAVMIEVIRSLNAKVTYLDETTLEIDSKDVNLYEAPADLMNKMRASFVVMGALLTKLGKAKTSMPGGCNIGSRPIDLHVKGFRSLGADVEEAVDYIFAKAGEEGLIGGNVYLDFPSVGATQNIMIAAVLAKGETTIDNAAKEPEIVDLANFLSKMGAKIRGAGTSTIVIKGVEKLTGTVHNIMPDRIETATFLVAAAITKGHVTVENAIPSHIRPVIAKLEEVGCKVEEMDDAIEVDARNCKFKATKIRTLPYPGFPTDVQAQMMALMTICKGESQVEETVFENRFMHAEELSKMGALIVYEGNVAAVCGVDQLVGTQVKATDLRAAAALILAGLVAEGETEVHNIYHLDRGYHAFEERLKSLGADIERIKE